MRDVSINKSDRTIPIARVVYGDKNTSGVRFLVDRYSDGVDLSDLGWSVKILTSAGNTDVAILEIDSTEDDRIALDWVLPAIVASAVGSTVIQIEAIGDNGERVWQSGERIIEVIDDVDAEPGYEEEDVSQLQQAIEAASVKVAALDANVTDLGGAVDSAVSAANSAASAANGAKDGITNAWNALYPQMSQNSVDAYAAARQANSAIPGVYAAGNYANQKAEAANTAATNANTAATNANTIYNTVKSAYESGALNGINGADGADGVSPTLQVQDIEGGKRVTITDADGTQSFDLYNGEAGATGPKGDTGAAGADGRDGSDASVTSENIAAALGYTPAKSSDVTSQSEKIETLEQLMPSSGATAGKVLKVLSVNADGTFVCEWADVGGSGGGGVSDVQVDGTSVVSGGVANVPIRTSKNNCGLVGELGLGLSINSLGKLSINVGSDNNVINRTSAFILPCNRLDLAVKSAMCDGKGTDWTADEQAAAQERIGILSSEEVLF